MAWADGPEDGSRESTTAADGKSKNGRRGKTKASEILRRSSVEFKSGLEHIVGGIAEKLPSVVAEEIYSRLDPQISAHRKKGMESVARNQRSVMSRLHPLRGGIVAGGKEVESDRATQISRLRKDAAEARKLSEDGYRGLDDLSAKQAEYRARGMLEKANECGQEIERLQSRAEEFKRSAKTLSELADGVENNTVKLDQKTWDKIRDSIRSAPQYFGAFSAVIPTESAREHEPEATTRTTYWGTELDFPFYDVADRDGGILAITGTRESIAEFFQANSNLRFVNSLGPEDQVEALEYGWAEHEGAKVIGVKAELFHGSGEQGRYTVIGPLRSGVRFAAEGVSGIAGGVAFAAQGIENLPVELAHSLFTAAETAGPAAKSAALKAAKSAAPAGLQRLLRENSDVLRASMVFTVTFYTSPASASGEYMVCTTAGVESTGPRNKVPPSASADAVAQAVDEAVAQLAENVTRGISKATRLPGKTAPLRRAEPAEPSPPAEGKGRKQEITWWETIRDNMVILPNQVKVRWKGGQDKLEGFRDFLERLNIEYGGKDQGLWVHRDAESGIWWAVSSMTEKTPEVTDYWTVQNLHHIDRSEEDRRFARANGGDPQTW